MPKNNENDNKTESGATLGGALFPMALCLLAGVLIGVCPALDLRELQTQLYEQLREQRGVQSQEIAIESAQTSDEETTEIVSILEVFKKPEIVYKPHQWAINKSVSTLSFEALQYGQKFSGSFDFDGEIIFNPEKLDESSVSIDIDISSISTGSLTRDDQARTIDWFDVGAFSKATFKATAFTKSGEGDDYIAHGALNLRGVDLPLDLPFSLQFSEKMPENEAVESARTEVEMLAQTSLNRSDFGVGQGEWKSEDVISDKVDIFVVLHAFMPERPQVAVQ